MMTMPVIFLVGAGLAALLQFVAPHYHGMASILVWFYLGGAAVLALTALIFPGRKA